MNKDFWTGKRVFLTGHTGFKGGWLSLWLQSLGAEVIGYSLNPPTKFNLFEVAGVAKGMTSIIGDIRDLEKLQSSMRFARPEIVIHMAAQPLVRLSYIEPVETYAINVMGTVHLLESARHVPSVKVVLVITSDKCYENKEWPWGYRELEPMGGHDPYSNSKGCVELIAASYRSSFFNTLTNDSKSIAAVALATARAGNVIGGGDWAADRLVPDILRAFEQGQPVICRNPNATRPWQHVLDPLSGYLTLAERLFTDGEVYAEGWNFGPHDDDERTVQWIVEQMAGNWGNGASWQLDVGKHPYEANFLKLDISKAKSRLGWKPRCPLTLALKQTTLWHQAWLADENMHKFCLDQILQYSVNLNNLAK